MSDLAVATAGLSKRFGERTVVDDVDLIVPRGSVYGFLGPNGSGKTTTIRMLLGLVRPHLGTAQLLGVDVLREPTSVLHRVGSLVEGPAFHPYLSGRANLSRLDAADQRADPRTSKARIEAALDRVGLRAAARKRYRAYSLGMKQRLALAAGLLAPRDLMILDEPTNGLDPQGTREVRALVASLAADGTTVFVSSHLLAEIEQVCTHLGIMRAGRLVAQGTVAEVLPGGASTVRVDTPDPAAAAEVLRRMGVQHVRITASTASGVPASTASGEPSASEPEAFVDALVEAGVPVRGFAASAPRLEDVFVALTGEGFDVEG